MCQMKWWFLNGTRMLTTNISVVDLNLCQNNPVTLPAINVLLAAAAYNFKRAMRVLLYLIKRITIELVNTSFMLKYSL